MKRQQTRNSGDHRSERGDGGGNDARKDVLAISFGTPSCDFCLKLGASHIPNSKSALFGQKLLERPFTEISKFSLGQCVASQFRAPHETYEESKVRKLKAKKA